MTAAIGQIFQLFARFGAGQYGEDLSLERHMLQSAALAQARGASEAVVVAALLHDIGYFLHADDGSPADAFEHEALAAAWLSQYFDREVTAPIALHVRAKRYLCAVEPDYFDCLSEASRLSLVVQGGPLTEGEAAAFAADPAFEAAVLLRRCDDLGKDVSAPTRDLEHYRALLTAQLRRAR